MSSEIKKQRKRAAEKRHGMTDREKLKIKGKGITTKMIIFVYFCIIYTIVDKPVRCLLLIIRCLLLINLYDEI